MFWNLPTAKQYVDGLFRHRWILLLCFASLTSLAIYQTSKLKIKSNLKELLPQNAVSVQALDHVIDRVGGVGNLIVAIESPNVKANQRFADELAKRLSTLPKQDVRSIHYRTTEVQTFFEKNALLYLPTSDLEELSKRVTQRLEYEKFRKLPIYFDLEEGPPADFDVEEFKTKFEKSIPPPPIESVKGYLGGNGGQLLIVMIRTQGSNLSATFAKDLISRVQEIIASLKPLSYEPQMKIGLSGTLPHAIEEMEVIRNDIVSTALLCLFLVALAVGMYFRRVRPVLIIGSTLLVALSWTFCLTRLVIGFLNAQTAFLGAIILGTGINYGIIVWGRYTEELMFNGLSRKALQLALSSSFKPTLLAAGTTAVAFAILWQSGIRSLSQFGFIGSSGILFSWIATMTVLPLLILIFEKRPGFAPTRFRRDHFSLLINFLSTFVHERRSAVLTSTIGMLFFSMFAIFWHAHDAIEYDFSKLRNKKSAYSGADYWDRKVGKLMKGSTVPTVAHLDTPHKAKEFCQIIKARVAQQTEDEQRVDSCKTLFDLLPEEQEKKLKIIAKLRSFLGEPWIKKLDKAAYEKAMNAKKLVTLTKITSADLPISLTQPFEDLQGDIGNIAFISPIRGKWLSDGRNLIAYADTIRDIELSDGQVVQAAGDALIYSDIIQIIKRETPILTLYSFLAILVVLTLLARSTFVMGLTISALMVGVILMLGICALFGLRINFFNFIVIPLTLGIAVDYALNISLRLVREKKLSLKHILQHTGGSVTLCSATTLIGYFVLTRANNQALVSFGKAAMIGEITCILAALILVPTLHASFSRRSFAQSMKGEPEGTTPVVTDPVERPPIHVGRRP